MSTCQRKSETASQYPGPKISPSRSSKLQPVSTITMIPIACPSYPVVLDLPLSHSRWRSHLVQCENVSSDLPRSAEARPQDIWSVCTEMLGTVLVPKCTPIIAFFAAEKNTVELLVLDAA
eukprot:scaffold172631_cov17-Tisochrysis_lutea.AAC.1